MLLYRPFLSFCLSLCFLLPFTLHKPVTRSSLFGCIDSVTRFQFLFSFLFTVTSLHIPQTVFLHLFLPSLYFSTSLYLSTSSPPPFISLPTSTLYFSHTVSLYLVTFPTPSCPPLRLKILLLPSFLFCPATPFPLRLRPFFYLVLHLIFPYCLSCIINLIPVGLLASTFSYSLPTPYLLALHPYLFIFTLHSYFSTIFLSPMVLSVFISVSHGIFRLYSSPMVVPFLSHKHVTCSLPSPLDSTTLCPRVRDRSSGQPQGK